MTYIEFVYLHLASILPAFMIGTYLLLNKKGTKSHRLLGKIYMLLMLETAIVTLFMSAEVGMRLFDHFGFIHLFSILTLYSVFAAYWAIKHGNVRMHRKNMIALYVGGILIAGAFTFAPGRMLHGWLFQ
jgi:uncharacterized membrane protein